MKIIGGLTVLNMVISAVVVNHFTSTHLKSALEIPNDESGARVARTLVSRESLMNVNTFQSSTSSAKTPVSFMEYYADCDGDGDPYWLVVEIGTTFQNIIRGSSYSFSIRTGDHWMLENVNTTYPGGTPTSPAGSPRVILEGRLSYIDIRDEKKVANLEQCFSKRHPDSRWWFPNRNSSPHKSRWAKINVDKIYLVGGFGDRAYIGDINTELYHGVKV